MKPKSFCFVTITAVMSMMGTNEVTLSPQKFSPQTLLGLNPEQLATLSPQQVEHRNIYITIKQQITLATQELEKVKRVGKINELKAELKLLEAKEAEKDFLAEYFKK